MNEHHAPKDDARLHQMSSAVPAATAPVPATGAGIAPPGAGIAPPVDGLRHDHAAAAAHVAAAAQAAAQVAAHAMAYDAHPKTSDEGRPYHPVRKESDRRPSDPADQRPKSTERKGSKKDVDLEEEEEEVGKIHLRRRDSMVSPVNPQDVLRFLQERGGEQRPIAHVGTLADEREKLPERRLKTHPPPATKDLYVDNERIKLNRSYKLRYNFMRKQASVPSSMQDHMQRFKKPPFKRVWKPGWCVDNISDRLAKLGAKGRKP